MELKYREATLSQEYVNHILKLARQYNILPSFLIIQASFESVWGTSNVAKIDKNWAGITWSPSYLGNPGIPKSKGSARPNNEGGHYVHYDNHFDGIADWVHLLRDGHFYKVSGQKDFDLAVKGLFKVGGAKYDYAASGYDHYLKGMRARRADINKSNNGALDILDDSFKGGGKNMGSLDLMIKWMMDRRGKVTYSMYSRLGPYSYDCSSAVYHALWAGGFKTQIGYAGNTETLFAENGHLFTEISRDQRRRGDIFVAGRQGASLGSGGHTGIYLGDGKIIHCNYSGNGITITPDTSNYTYWPCRWFRIKGASTTAQVPTYKAPAKPFKALSVGSTATIREGASRWQTGESGIANYVGKSYKIIQVKNVKQSYSKRAYLLKGLMSWALEQDIVEARAEWDKNVSQRKPMDEIVDMVVAGKFGNGQERIDKLKAEGYDPDEVQKAVNVYYAATDVIAGKYGVGQARIDALKAKGLDPQAVQSKVNEMLR